MDELVKKSKAESRSTRFKRLVETAEAVRDYAIFMLDPEGNILTWNPGAERLTGYSSDEIIGQNISRFHAPEDLERRLPRQELKQAKKHGRYEEVGWRLKRDGTRYWAAVVITKLTDREGQLIGFSNVMQDLRERKEAEDEFWENEERDAALEAIHKGLKARKSRAKV